MKLHISTTSIISMYEAGYSIRLIGSIVGMSYHGVYLRLVKAGVKLRPRSYPAPHQLHKAVGRESAA
jgi:hypothetical protein